MEHVNTISRILEFRVRQALARQKSVLLLGPRQTGKTTLVEKLKPDLLLNFLRPEVRQRYERAPQLLGAEVEALAPKTRASRPVVVLDEVQRVPELVNVVQHLVDRRLARFVLTGSSARKLRRRRRRQPVAGPAAALASRPVVAGRARPGHAGASAPVRQLAGHRARRQ